MYAVERTDYERYVALVLNAQRSDLRQANTQRVAIDAVMASAFAGAPLNAGWFQAMHDSPEEALAAYHKHLAYSVKPGGA